MPFLCTLLLWLEYGVSPETYIDTWFPRQVLRGGGPVRID
jgi:hypothetical protein